MIVAIVLVSFIDKLKEFNSFEESGLIVSKRNSKGVSVLTPFDETFVKQYLCFLITVMNQAYFGREVNLIAFSSYRCELYFAFLRMMSHFDNSFPKIEQVVQDQMIL